MGTVPATTLIKNIRENLTDQIPDAQLTEAEAGNIYKNSRLLECLNKAKDRIWDIVRSVREDYFQTVGNTSVTLDSATKVYTLPTTCWQLTAIKATTSGYERLKFTAMSQSDSRYKELDMIPQGDQYKNDELFYDIISTGKLKLANFPPATIATSIDFIASLSDYTLAVDSVSEIMDQWREFLEAYASMLALETTPKDPRYIVYRNKVKDLKPDIIQSVSRRQIRDAEYVAPYNPS